VPGFLGHYEHAWLLKREIEKRNDFPPLLVNYDRRDSLGDCGKDLTKGIQFIIEHQMGSQTQKPTIDFITFSLGALILRVSQTENPDFWSNNKFRKLTMLAPVNRASSWAQKLGEREYTRKLMLSWAEWRWPSDPDLGLTWEGKPTLGAELQNLTAEDIDNRYPHLDVSHFSDVMVANGELPIGGNPFLTGANDGTITIEETKLPDDYPNVQYYTFRSSHSMLMMKPRIVKQVAKFNEFDRFEKMEIDPAKIRPGKIYPGVWPVKRPVQYEPPRIQRMPPSPHGSGRTLI